MGQAAVAAAGAMAVGNLAGAYIQSQSAREAMDRQTSADRRWRHQQGDQFAAAMGYARGRDAVSDQRYQQYWDAMSGYRARGNQAGRNQMSTLADYRRLADQYATDRFEMGDFTTDPGYEFRLGQGQQAVERMSGAGGSPFSGATLRALSEYNQNFASNEYANVYARRFGEYQSNEQQQLAHLMGLSDIAGQYGGVAGMGVPQMPGPATNNFPGMPGSTPPYSGADGAMAQGNIWGGFANNMGSLAALYFMNQDRQPRANPPT